MTSGRRSAALEAPALALADRLATLGFQDLADEIREHAAIPPFEDDGRSKLIKLLDLCAETAEDGPNRTEARRLAAVARDLPTAIGRGGIVFAAWVANARAGGAEVEDEGYFEAVWQPDDDDPEDNFYEVAPALPTATDIIAWSTARSDYIVFAPRGSNGRQHWAGSADPPPEFEHLPRASP